jgi:antitoxin ParD1/3/4
MRSTTALSITLPHKMAEMVRKKVKSGEYASESEVIREGLRALNDRDVSYREWMRSEIERSAKEMREHPERVISLEDLMVKHGVGIPKARLAMPRSKARSKE